MITEMKAVKNSTGKGVPRHGVVLLAVLLLTCTLMAGAVSAEATEFNQSNFSMGTKPTVMMYTINSPGIYTLNESVTGNITIHVSNWW